MKPNLCFRTAFLLPAILIFALSSSQAPAHSPVPEQLEEISGWESVEAGCRSSDIAGATPAQLIRYLKNNRETCLRFLWHLTADMGRIYSTANMNAVLDEITSLAPAFNSSNSAVMTQVLLFARIGFYHAFYKKPVTFNAQSMTSKATTALQALERNSNFFRVDQSAKVLGQWVGLIDTASYISHHFSASLERIIRIYVDRPELTRTYSHRILLSNVFSVLQRSFSQNEFKRVTRSSIIEALAAFSKNKQVARENVSLTNNAIWAIGRAKVARISSIRAVATSRLEEILKLYQEFPIPYYWAYISLAGNSGCYSFSDGSLRLCKNDVKLRLKEKLFPNTYRFDNGTIIFKTPLGSDRIIELYEHVKQSLEGFRLLTQMTEPVSGDRNQTVTLMIYGSRGGYENLSKFLFGFDGCCSGGMYLESRSTLYTYDSGAYLPHITKHEYLHYLTGRFIVPGMLGKRTISKNNRVTWFNEGLSELLPGSTWDDIGIIKNLLSRIRRDGERNWMTIKQIVESRYGQGFKFYRYSAALLGFFIENRPDIMRDLVLTVRDGNANRYDSIIRRLKSDTVLQNDFRQYLREVTQAPLQREEVMSRVSSRQERQCRADLFNIRAEKNAVQSALGQKVKCVATSPRRKTARGGYYFDADLNCMSDNVPSESTLSGFTRAMESRNFSGYRATVNGNHLHIVAPIVGTPALCGSDSEGICPYRRIDPIGQLLAEIDF